MAAETGVKLAMMCLVAQDRARFVATAR